jgi:CPA2 family monovalent cation:H+ antiporter-2
MHSLDLILTLAGGLGAALVFGFATQRAGLSPIVGYLIAGLLVGPYTPGFVADRHMAEQLAEVGIILLMFGVGMQFHVEELVAVWRIAVPGAIAQSLVATGLGTLVALAFGWTPTAGVIFGIGLSVASTVVLIRVLSDHRDLHTRAGHIAVGWLVVEDLFTVLVLVVMPVVFGRTGESSVAYSLALASVKVAVLTALVLVVGRRVVPWLLTRVAITQSRELFTLTVLALALCISVASAQLFGVSMALGAFLAGLVVGRSEFAVRAASEALPMRDAFAVLFFVSVGMLLDPSYVMKAPLLILAALAVVLVGKPLVALALALAWGYPAGVALRIAAALAQIGEFSFIVAAVGADLGLVTDEVRNTLIATAIVSIASNPLLYRAAVRLETWVPERKQAPYVSEAKERDAMDRDPRHRAVVIGYGPVGRTVARLLRQNDITPTIVDLNIETVQALRAQGLPAVYGDASRPETLISAGVPRAGAIILSVAGLPGAREIIRASREINPSIQILARTAYIRELVALKDAGATIVFSGEGEVALAFTEALLTKLGATPEQIDRERARVHEEILTVGTSAA